MDKKVLVVGTTSDYIDWIRLANPGRALFLTAPEIRQEAHEADPSPAEEILCSLEDQDTVVSELLTHLDHHHFSLNGITCFDCESLELAAWLAGRFTLPYPSVESVRCCRDKYSSKSLWKRNGLNCPEARLVQSADGVYDFLQERDTPCVIKPLSGSGSELVFHCASRKDCDKAVQLIHKGLIARQTHRLYKSTPPLFLAEECIHGPEYSCDFILRGARIEILRLSKKIKDIEKPFGTIDGYLLLDREEGELKHLPLVETLSQGAVALGISDAICMVDFIVRDDELFLLEMTPRPGGDCIPVLLKHAQGLDMLTYALDFAQQQDVPQSARVERPCVALRLHGRCTGTIRQIDDHLLQEDPRVLEIYQVRKVGHHIKMPPVDYESWYLGHVLFYPSNEKDIDLQARELRKKFIVEISKNESTYQY